MSADAGGGGGGRSEGGGGEVGVSRGWRAPTAKLLAATAAAWLALVGLLLYVLYGPVGGGTSVSIMRNMSLGIVPGHAVAGLAPNLKAYIRGATAADAAVAAQAKLTAEPGGELYVFEYRKTRLFFTTRASTGTAEKVIERVYFPPN